MSNSEELINIIEIVPWAGRARNQMESDKIPLKQTVRMTASQIVDLSNKYNVMISQYQGKKIIFLDELGRRFSQR